MKVSNTYNKSQKESLSLKVGVTVIKLTLRKLFQDERLEDKSLWR